MGVSIKVLDAQRKLLQSELNSKLSAVSKASQYVNKLTELYANDQSSEDEIKKAESALSAANNQASAAQKALNDIDKTLNTMANERKTESKLKANVTKATSTVNSARSKMTSLQRKVASLKRAVSKARGSKKKRLQAQLRAANKACNAAKSKYNKAASTLTNARNTSTKYQKTVNTRDEAASKAQLKRGIIASAKASMAGKDLAYIIPAYPASQRSYYSFSVEEETPTHTETLATNPVESGLPIGGIGQQEQPTIAITGKFYGADNSTRRDKLSRLIAYADNQTEIEYHGIQTINHAQISEIAIQNTSPMPTNYLAFTMTIVEVRFALSNMSEAVSLPAKKGKVKAKRGSAKKKTNNKKYVIVRRGNTYWGWWRQYGTSIATLRKWNKWRDRFIPIGKKARVK